MSLGSCRWCIHKVTVCINNGSLLSVAKIEKEKEEIQLHTKKLKLSVHLYVKVCVLTIFPLALSRIGLNFVLSFILFSFFFFFLFPFFLFHLFSVSNWAKKKYATSLSFHSATLYRKRKFAFHFLFSSTFSQEICNAFFLSIHSIQRDRMRISIHSVVAFCRKTNFFSFSSQLLIKYLYITTQMTH